MKAIVFDVDGTLTDGKIYMGNEGELFKAFDIKDGCGIHDLMPRYDLIPIVITARQSDIVKNRCAELDIKHCYQGCRDKVAKLKEVAKMLSIKPNKEEIYEEIAYIGDDIIDIPVMRCCGVKGCPRDAVNEVKSIVDYVSQKTGGNGAVREFIEWIIEVYCKTENNK